MPQNSIYNKTIFLSQKLEYSLLNMNNNLTIRNSTFSDIFLIIFRLLYNNKLYLSATKNRKSYKKWTRNNICCLDRYIEIDHQRKCIQVFMLLLMMGKSLLFSAILNDIHRCVCKNDITPLCPAFPFYHGFPSSHTYVYQN